MQISQTDVVRLRRARWRVLDIRAYDGCQVVVVAGAEPDNAGVKRRFILPFDGAERVERRLVPVRASRPRWRRSCRALLAMDTPPGGLHCAREARIELLPHQLEPALAVVRGLASRVLLADDVGLGKTIQAGLIASELHGLGAADRVLVVTPAGLRDQWAQELSERFRLAAEVIDVRALRHRSASLPLGMNPWQSFPIAIASIDYIKRPDVLAAVVACRWDLVIVDEAHGVAGDSDRHAGIAALARRAPYVVLLSATPHSGNRRDFVSLCAIGQAAGDRLLLFRRSRHDVRIGGRRRVHCLHVRMSRDEAVMHELLLQFSRAVRSQQRNRGRGYDCWLALSVLHKRALSSSRSLHVSIERRLDTLVDDPAHVSQLQLPLDDRGGELTTGDESPPWSPLLGLDDPAKERQLLAKVSDAAARAATHETKLNALRRLLNRVDEPAIVFTEYRDTLQQVRVSLGLPCLTLHGGMDRQERQVEIAKFTSGRARLLLATDAAAEGLNLQQACRLVVNLELPWNPMRLEQRIGRVDRIGQKRPVHVFHLIGRRSAEVQILARLRARVAAVRSDIGGADPLGSQSEPTVAPSQSPPTFPLGIDAAAEAERVAQARRFTSTGTGTASRLELDAPLVLRSRRWQTRVALAGRTLRFWRASAVDASGRTVGSHIVVIATRPKLSVEDGEDVESCVTQAAGAWRARVSEIQRSFADSRLARERAIQSLRGDDDQSPAVSQSGLFDRRLDRARMAVAAADEAAGDHQAERLREIERSRVISFPPPELQLLLVP